MCYQIFPGVLVRGSHHPASLCYPATQTVINGWRQYGGWYQWGSRRRDVIAAVLAWSGTVAGWSTCLVSDIVQSWKYCGSPHVNENRKKVAYCAMCLFVCLFYDLFLFSIIFKDVNESEMFICLFVCFVFVFVFVFVLFLFFHLSYLNKQTNKNKWYLIPIMIFVLFKVNNVKMPVRNL